MAEQGKQSFEELMGKLPSYGPLMDTPASYKLIAVHNGTYWSLAIKGDQPDQDLPYVTIELISDDGIKVLRAVRKVDYELLHLLKRKDVGTYGPNKKLRHLCKAADDTFHGIDKWHEFCPQLVNSLGYQVDFDKTTSTYYTIEVFEGSGYRMCYLGTANNGMLYGPTFPSGNLAVYWKKLDRDEEKSKVINFVTALSPDPTFMQLGPQISGNTYQVILRGPGQDFCFINSRDEWGVYAISTTSDDNTTTSDDNMINLLPQDSGQIVAVAETAPQFIFRVMPKTPQTPPTLAAR